MARSVFDGGTDPSIDDWRMVTGGVVQADTVYEGPFDVTYHPGSGRPRVLPQFRRVARLQARRDEDSFRRRRYASFDADDRRVALAVSTYNAFPGEGAGPDIDAPDRSELLTATLGGPATRLHRCERGDIGPVGVDGDVVAWVGTKCEYQHTTIGVRDLSGADPPVTISAPPERAFLDVRVAGDYVLGRIWEPTFFGPNPDTAPPELVVYRRATGAEVLRVPDAVDYDLQGDGKLVTLRAAAPDWCSYDELAWYSPEDPRAHVLSPRACSGSVLVARDRILWNRRISETGYGAATTDLAGGDVQPVFAARDPAKHDAPHSPFAYDGARVAYMADGCDRYDIVVDTVRELAERGPLPLETCLVSFRAVAPRARLDRRGGVTQAIGCPSGCLEARVRLRDVASGRDLRLRRNGGVYDWLDLAPVRRDGSRRVRLDLTAKDRTRLTKLGRLRVELRVSVPQPGGPSRTFARRLTLLPR